jgi:hypothetical protein
MLLAGGYIVGLDDSTGCPQVKNFWRLDGATNDPIRLFFASQQP